MADSLAVETRGLVKVYGALRAVDGIDLDVGTGQVFGFLGPNGAGKTTTIRLLLALQRPSGGSVRVLGLDPVTTPVGVHRRTGYLPGELALHPRLTGTQHVAWTARCRGLHPDAAGDLMERFEVEGDRPVRELSKGNRQKIGIVVALLGDPDLLVLDEPTSGLDPLVQLEFDRAVREAVDRGRTVFLSSHDLDEVQRLADHVAIIREGRIAATDSVTGLRLAAPEKVTATLARTADRRPFDVLDGVTVTRCEGTSVALDVRGPVGPVLRALADQDPVDVSVRHADLDEVFLGYYREDPVR